jgi:hypothetical protein
LLFRVETKRELEKQMVKSGSAYDHGRVGAEIAYTVLYEFFGIRGLVIAEPSSGGRDLFSTNGSVGVQARFIADFTQFMPMTRDQAILDQIANLIRKLQQDFRHQRKMRSGYAILSYVDDEGAVHGITVERIRNDTYDGVKNEMRAWWDSNPRHAG